MRQRIVLVALAGLVAACGQPMEAVRTSSSGTTVTVQQTVTTVPVTTAAGDATTTTSDNPGEHGPDYELMRELYDLLGGQVDRPAIVAGEPIDRPSDFPAIDDLALMTDGSMNPGHQRALITSYLGPSGDPETLLAAGADLQFAMGMVIIITYFDGIVVWDYATSSREVLIPGQGVMTRDQDGVWVESTAFEWPMFGPIPEQGQAQTQASALLAAPRSQVLGYERIAGVETIRVTHSAEGETIDGWVDSEGLVMRIVFSTSDPHEPTTMIYEWNVETLDVVLEGPLPPGL